jgi:RNA polymerase sigma-70 factor (ECF subfamily)
LGLEQFRPYLTLLARLHWDKRLQGVLDPADLVQQTFVEAYQNMDQFRGGTERELAGWLRQGLVHNLLDALKKLLGSRGTLPREAQLRDAVDGSSSRIEAWLAAEQSSPSEHVAKEEQTLRLAAALEQLPEPQREAVILHHLQGLSLADAAGRLGRTEASVAGLLRRGLKRLRELLSEPG